MKLPLLATQTHSKETGTAGRTGMLIVKQIELRVVEMWKGELEYGFEDGFEVGLGLENESESDEAVAALPRRETEVRMWQGKQVEKRMILMMMVQGSSHRSTAP